MNQECTPKNVHNQIIAGLKDGDTIEELLKEKNLSLDTTV